MAYPLFKELFERSDASGSRSTILKPLTWCLSILVGGVLSLSYAKAPMWLIIFFCAIIGIIVTLFLFAFLYCLFKDRDALRSESFSIQKMAIEKGMYGDSNIGLIKITEEDSKKDIELPQNTERE